MITEHVKSLTLMVSAYFWTCNLHSERPKSFPPGLSWQWPSPLFLIKDQDLRAKPPRGAEGAGHASYVRSRWHTQTEQV